MGRRLTKIKITPGQNEQLETTITLQKEARSVIHGVVLDEKKCPIKDAVVKLFAVSSKENCCELIPLFHAFTDECGQFLFGPLTPGKQYVVKVWHKEVTIRRIPGTPFECKAPCSNHKNPSTYEDTNEQCDNDYFASEDTNDGYDNSHDYSDNYCEPRSCEPRNSGSSCASCSIDL